jgi:hypothetical protein
MEPPSTLNSGCQRSHPLLDAMLSFSHKLRRRGGCCCPKISNKIRDREISLMSNRGYNGKIGRHDNARERLIIETREIFHQTSPSRDNDQVNQ